MASRGSTLFVLTWKTRATPWGRRICALRASALRTSGSGFSSWPSPNAREPDKTPEEQLAHRAKMKASGRSAAHARMGVSVTTLGAACHLATWPTPQTHDAQGPKTEEAVAAQRAAKRGGCSNLNETARLATWPTCRATDGDKGVRTDDGAKTERDRCAGVRGMDLQSTAALASWATPAAHEAGGTPEQFLARKEAARAKGAELGVSLTSLSLQAQLTSWATPTTRDWRDGRASEATMARNARPLNEQEVQLAASGPTPNGSPAATGSSGQLNPAHSRWLQACPSAWDDCAPHADDWQRWQDLMAAPCDEPSGTGSDGSEGTGTP